MKGNLVALGVLIALALLVRMALILPGEFFESRLAQYSLYMPLATVLSTLVVVLGLRARLIQDQGLLLVLVLASGPVLLVFAATTRDPVFLATAGLATVHAIGWTIWALRHRSSLTFAKSDAVRLALIGLACGLLVCVVFDAVAVARGATLDFSHWGPRLFNGLWVFAMMLFLAPAFEEPLFRGILAWMPRTSLTPLVLVFVAQWGLFWLGHAYYFPERPLDLFVLVPVAGLAFGGVALVTRSLVPAFFAHAFVNAFYVSFLQWVPK